MGTTRPRLGFSFYHLFAICLALFGTFLPLSASGRPLHATPNLSGWISVLSVNDPWHDNGTPSDFMRDDDHRKASDRLAGVQKTACLSCHVEQMQRPRERQTTNLRL